MFTSSKQSEIVFCTSSFCALLGSASVSVVVFVSVFLSVEAGLFSTLVSVVVSVASVVFTDVSASDLGGCAISSAFRF